MYLHLFKYDQLLTKHYVMSYEYRWKYPFRLIPNPLCNIMSENYKAQIGNRYNEVHNPNENRYNIIVSYFLWKCDLFRKCNFHGINSILIRK